MAVDKDPNIITHSEDKHLIEAWFKNAVGIEVDPNLQPYSIQLTDNLRARGSGLLFQAGQRLADTMAGFSQQDAQDYTALALELLAARPATITNNCPPDCITPPDVFPPPNPTDPPNGGPPPPPTPTHQPPVDNAVPCSTRDDGYSLKKITFDPFSTRIYHNAGAWVRDINRSIRDNIDLAVRNGFTNSLYLPNALVSIELVGYGAGVTSATVGFGIPKRDDPTGTEITTEEQPPNKGLGANLVGSLTVSYTVKDGQIFLPTVYTPNYYSTLEPDTSDFNINPFQFASHWPYAVSGNLDVDIWNGYNSVVLGTNDKPIALTDVMFAQAWAYLFYFGLYLKSVTYKVPDSPDWNWNNATTLRYEVPPNYYPYVSDHEYTRSVVTEPITGKTWFWVNLGSLTNDDGSTRYDPATGIFHNGGGNASATGFTFNPAYYIDTLYSDGHGGRMHVTIVQDGYGPSDCAPYFLYNFDVRATATDHDTVITAGSSGVNITGNGFDNHLQFHCPPDGQWHNIYCKTQGGGNPTITAGGGFYGGNSSEYRFDIRNVKIGFTSV